MLCDQVDIFFQQHSLHAVEHECYRGSEGVQQAICVANKATTVRASKAALGPASQAAGQGKPYSCRT